MTVLNPNNPIGQINIFALPRSGGTLLNIFLRKFICFKCSLIHPSMLHSNNVSDYGPYNILLLRHPYGVYGSMLHVDSIDTVSNQIKVDPKNAIAKLNDINNMYDIFIKLLDDNKENNLVVRYEDFHENYDYFLEIVKHYDIDLNNDDFENFKSDFDVNEIRKDIYSNNNKEKDFRPNHVSSGKGSNTANMKLVPSGIREEVTDRLQPFCDKLQYKAYSFDGVPCELTYDLH
tara:strand:- start:1178 stop:1873 length:696 start_codon:yes stop_codon:yes gene_type:complete